MAQQSLQEAPSIEWRRLSRVLWVGRRDGRHVGSIERGHDYVATDGEGVVRGRYRDLASAEASFDAVHEPAGSARARRMRLWPYLIGGVTVVLAGAGVSAAFLLL